MSVLAVWCVAAVAQNGAPALYDRASRFFAARKLPECMAALDETLQADPHYVPALTLRAKVAMAISRFDVARTNLEAALAADPNSSYAQFLYGMEFYLLNDLPAAERELEKARKLEHPDPRASLYLGLTYESLGKNAEALTLYEEAVHREEKAGSLEAETFLTGARLLLMLGRTEECAQWLARADAIAPASRDVHFELARLAMQTGDAARAVTEGQAALRLSEGSTPEDRIHYLLVRAYGESGNKDAAEREAQILRAAEATRKQ